MAFTVSGKASYSGSGLASVEVLFKNITQDYFVHCGVTDASGDYSKDVDTGGHTVANNDTYWVIFYKQGYYSVESGTADTGVGSATKNTTILEAAISRATVSTDIWDFFRIILSEDPTLDTATTYIGGSYPEKFIRGAGGLPFITIRKPNVTEEYLTLQKRVYTINGEIEIKSNSASNLKLITEEVREAFAVAKPAIVVNQIGNFRITTEDSDIEKRREEKTVHSATLTFEALWLGGGRVPLRNW